MAFFFFYFSTLKNRNVFLIKFYGWSKKNEWHWGIRREVLFFLLSKQLLAMGYGVFFFFRLQRVFILFFSRV